METNVKTETGDLIRLIGARWILLEELYREELSPKEIAHKIGKRLPWVSTQLKSLKDNGLATSRRSEDGRSKLYSLTEKGRRIYSAIMEALSPPIGKAAVPSGRVGLIVRVLRDEGLSVDVRSAAASALRRLCSPESEIEGGREDLREFFLDAIDKIGEYVGEPAHVLLALEGYIAHQLGREEFEWLKSKCYPRLRSQFEKDKSLKVRASAMRVLFRAYYRCRDMEEFSDMADELSKLFMETFFDTDEKEEIAYRSWEILSSQEGDERIVLIDRLYEGAKSDDDRVRERCSKRIVGLLESSESIRQKSKTYQIVGDASLVLS